MKAKPITRTRCEGWYLTDGNKVDQKYALPAQSR